MSRPFANLDGLVRLSQNPGVDVRRPLLRVLTDLYVQEPSHTREEEQQYIELALRLIPDVDVPTRIVVARKLSAYAPAPQAVLKAILDSTPEAAQPFIEGPEEQANPERTDAAGPLGAGSSPASTVSSIETVEREQPQPPALTWDQSAGEAFLRTSAVERGKILENLVGPDTNCTADVIDLPPRPGARGRLERAALQRNKQEFARELQLALGIPSRMAWRITQDDSGELIIVAAKALEMRVEMLVRILLILNPAIGESVERVFTLTSLYERLLPEAVTPIVAGWRDDAAVRAAARFRSVHAPEGSDEPARARDASRLIREEPRRDQSASAHRVAPARRQDAG